MRRFADSIFGRILGWVARGVCRHHRWLVYPQLVAAILCAIGTIRWLTLDMNRDHLLAADLKYHQIYLKFLKEFQISDVLAVVIESGSIQRNRRFIEDLADRVRPHTELFSEVFYKTDLTTLGSKALLLASKADLQQMCQAVHQFLPFMQKFADATNLNSLFAIVNSEFRTAPASPTVGAESLVSGLPFLQSILDRGRSALLNPGRPLVPDLEDFLSGGQPAEQHTYVTFDQDRIFLLTARPRSDATMAAAIDRLRQAIRETQFAVPGVNVGLTGGPVLDYDEMQQAQHDSIVATVAALIICLLIFILAYHELGRPLKAALCLVIGLGYTMGFTTLTVGHLNILSITFAPMLIGLAIDFGVHFITRYEEERRHGRLGAEAISHATVLTGQGIVTGALTTAAAFLAMALTHFKGIQEMGAIAGSGLLLCLVPMMIALPALLLEDHKKLPKRPRRPLGHRRGRIEKFWLEKPGLVVVFTALLCCAAAVEWPKLYFDYDLLHMQSPSLASVVFEKTLLRAAPEAGLSMAVIADSLAQAQDYERRIKRLPTVRTVESAVDFLTGNQNAKLQLARALQHDLAGLHLLPLDPRPPRLEELSATLWYLTGYAGLAADQAHKDAPKVARQLSSFRAAIVEFRQALLSGQPQVPAQLARYQQALFGNLRRSLEAIQAEDTRGSMRPQDLPAVLRHRFIGTTGKYLLEVYAREDLWQHEVQHRLIQQLQSVVPPDRVTGSPLQLYEYTSLLKKSYQQAALYALAAIALMILLHFRSLVCVVLSLLPVAIGAAWLLGFMGLAGIPFNPANIMTLPLVVGIGVTNGIQILNRFAEEQKPAIFAKSTGKAVLVSGLTSITGFGTLILAKHQGIKSLGEVMAVGIAACMIAGLSFLPALLTLCMRAGWRIRPRSSNPVSAC